MVHRYVDRPLSADSDTVTASEAESIAEPGASQVYTVSAHRGLRRYVVGALALSVLLAAAAVAASTNASTAAEWLGGDSAVSSKAFKSEMHRKGCKNWKDVMLRSPLLNQSKKSCATECAKTAGCFWANFQPETCDSYESLAKGACYLFAKDCELEDNHCWDIEAAPGPPGILLAGPRTGCSNWADIKLGDPVVVKNSNECGSRCASTKGCTAINFQADPCEGATEAVEEGACYLFKEGCTPASNTCWDLYDFMGLSSVEASTYSMADAAKGATSMSVASTDGFSPGSKVTIQNGPSKQEVTVNKVSGRRLTAAPGTIFFSPGLDWFAPAGTMLFIAKLQSTTTTTPHTTTG